MRGPNLRNWTVGDVCDWLELELEMPPYVVAAFRDSSISGKGKPWGAVLKPESWVALGFER
jgi:hypothetical protein